MISILRYILSTGEASPDSQYYNGGHFNLFISTSDLQSVLKGDFGRFQNAFAPSGLLASIIGGSRTPEANGYTLHSQFNPGKLADQFHLDQFNWYNPGHVIGDVIGGNIGSPCLDPPWK